MGLLAGAVVLSLLIAALTGMIIFPGLLLLLVVYYFLNGPRGIALVSDGVVVVARSLWTDRPDRIVTFVPHQALLSVTEGTRARVRLNLGVEQVWVLREEHDRILHVAGLSMPAAARAQF